MTKGERARDKALSAAVAMMVRHLGMISAEVEQLMRTEDAMKGVSQQTEEKKTNA